jgi:hypothetical protein
MLDVNDGGIADDALHPLELTALSNFVQRLSFESTGVKRVT